jgi:hypothetical protein
METLRVVLAMILGIALPLAFQLWDRKRLPPALKRRTWGYATWGSVLLWLGPLTMLGWIFVTRPPWRRCFVAIPHTMAPLVTIVAVDLGLSLALGEPLEISPVELLAELAIMAIVVLLLMIMVELVTRGWRRLSRRPMPEDDWRAIARELEAE